MQYAYGVLFIVSLLLVFVYFMSVKKRKEEHWLLILLICVSIVNLGYLLISISKTVDFAIAANKVVYLGQVFIPMNMLMLITKLCGFKYNKKLIGILILFAVIMFGIVCTTGYTDWYYTNAYIENYAGGTVLHKEYGFLHPVNVIYVSLYFVSMVALVIYSFKKHKGVYQKQATAMLIVVLGNILMWLVQKVIPWNFELLSITYLMSAGSFLLLTIMLQDYVHINDIPVYSPKEQEKLGDDISVMSMEEKIKKVLYFVHDGEILCTREKEILELILANKKRKDIAAELYLSENTIKTYTRTLYSKLGVTCREELYSLLLEKESEA